MLDVIESDDSNCRCRAVAKREAVMATLATLVADIDCDSFKAAVAGTLHKGYERAAVYGDVLRVLYGLHT